ncbi:MAG: aminodeoxychorismate/anthranilate synthase component II [Bacteroidetes bacterium]|nr:aminodeoxychorismate/anthranilate synthase component II [Bacteroidota bacterium]
MVLLLDNYDSFTYMLRDYIRQAGEECIVVRNDEMSIEEIAALSFDSIVISPGPKAPADAGVTLGVIRTFYQTTPILGICLGHQAIGEFFGARLVRASVPMHGKTTTITHTDHPIFHNIPQDTDVMRYHSLILDHDLAETQGIASLRVIAQTGDGEIMGIAHRELPIAGLQFHPESVLTAYGVEMVRNWFEYLRVDLPHIAH